MKKIFAIFVLILYAPSVYATCSVDIDKPCTGQNQDVEIISIFDNPHLESYKETNQDNVVPHNNLISNPLDDTANQSYDPDCMFGVCLP